MFGSCFLREDERLIRARKGRVQVARGKMKTKMKKKSSILTRKRQGIYINHAERPAVSFSLASSRLVRI